MSLIVPVIVNQSTLDNGRIYIEDRYRSHFGALRFGERATAAKGDPIVLEVNGEAVHTDLRRMSGLRFGPRCSVQRYLRAVRAQVGDAFRLVEVAPRRYRLEPGSC